MEGLTQYQNIYFSGIGGIGMSALAQLLKLDGKEVQGSDIARSHIIKRLQRKGISIHHVQDGSKIDSSTDLYVYSDALPRDSAEYKKAEKLGVTMMSYFEAVGHYMKEFEYTIAISGTHGKSTTTAMIAHILTEAGEDPTVIVGSVAKEFDSNARYGSKKYLIVEACEHKSHMLLLYPDMIVLTNIEEDHLDHYRDLEHIVMTFQKYINHLPKNGVLIKNTDDSESKELGSDYTIATYGIHHDAQTMAADIQYEKKKQTFTVGNTDFELKLPGKFNVYNALAAIAASRQLDVSDHVIQHALKTFKGIWRRFEVLGAYKGATVISDYAHHPTAIHSTIKAAREFYPKQRVVVAFQPHQRSRTKKLFDQFADSFAEADFTIIQEIFDVPGREKEKDAAISSKDLVAAVEKRGKYALYSKDVAATRKEIDENIEKNNVLLIMGAGDIYKLAEDLIP